MLVKGRCWLSGCALYGSSRLELGMWLVVVLGIVVVLSSCMDHRMSVRDLKVMHHATHAGICDLGRQ